MFKFIFAFHIFVLEGSMVNRIDSQFVFDSLVECRTAEMLIQKQNQIVTRDTLITALWDDEAFVSDNTLTVNVNRLRKKLSDIGMDTQIETKVGKGYMAHE